MLSPVDDRILRAFLQYGYLTPDQITRLYYSKGSRTSVYAKLKKLKDAGYLERLALPRPTAKGTVPAVVYLLSRKGRQYLDEIGLSVPHPLYLSRAKEHTYLFIAHTSAVNDFLISAELLARTVPHIELAEMIHERVLQARPSKVEITVGSQKSRQTVTIVPDAWLDFRIRGEQGTSQSCLTLELDRGTMDKTRWQRKVQGLVAWAKGPYRTEFQTTSLTIAVVATPGQRRADALRSWTKELLEQVGEQRLAGLFLVAGVDPKDVAPQELFLSPLFSQPFGNELVPLLEI